MIRFLLLQSAALALVCGAASIPVSAQTQIPGQSQAHPAAVHASAAAKTHLAARRQARKEASTGSATSGALELGKFGDWGAYVAGTGANKVCFALSQPQERLPKGLNRDPAYIFLTSRPAQNVRNEVAFMLGFALKANVDGAATIDGHAFALESKDKTAFVKNAAEEPQMVQAMRAGTKLSVKTTSLRGNVTTDNYSLSGLSKALDKVQSDCK
jgi:hypothetical protein